MPQSSSRMCRSEWHTPLCVTCMEGDTTIKRKAWCTHLARQVQCCSIGPAKCGSTQCSSCAPAMASQSVRSQMHCITAGFKCITPPTSLPAAWHAQRHAMQQPEPSGVKRHMYDTRTIQENHPKRNRTLMSISSGCSSRLISFSQGLRVSLVLYTAAVECDSLERAHVKFACLACLARGRGYGHAEDALRCSYASS